ENRGHQESKQNAADGHEDSVSMTCPPSLSTRSQTLLVSSTGWPPKGLLAVKYVRKSVSIGAPLTFFRTYLRDEVRYTGAQKQIDRALCLTGSFAGDTMRLCPDPST